MMITVEKNVELKPLVPKDLSDRLLSYPVMRENREGHGLGYALPVTVARYIVGQIEALGALTRDLREREGQPITRDDMHAIEDISTVLTFLAEEIYNEAGYYKDMD